MPAFMPFRSTINDVCVIKLVVASAADSGDCRPQSCPARPTPLCASLSRFHLSDTTAGLLDAVTDALKVIRKHAGA